jgi:Zn finger protein HypA/HybF involved in hydrogenase expression
LHEYTIAVGIIEALINYAEHRRVKVRRFRILVGQLSMLDLDSIQTFVNMLMSKSALDGADYSIEIERAQLGCGTCNAVMSFDEMIGDLEGDVRESIHFFPEMVASFRSCKVCGSSDLRVLSGRGVRVVDVVVKPE